MCKGERIMKLIRDAFRSDVLILDTADIEALTDGKELKASGMVIKKSASVMDCILLEREKVLADCRDSNYIFIPSHQWASFQREVERNGIDFLGLKCIGDGSVNMLGMTLFRYDGKMIKVL
jgi:hypothetical protein